MYTYTVAFALLWGSWALYWWASSRGVKTNVWRESVPSRLLHIVPLVIAGLLLAIQPWPGPGLDQRFVPFSTAIFWAGWLISASGLLFTVWARRHFGRNWSGTVTLKLDHELVVTGPYALVRHPIYTGLLFGFLGSAIAVGEWRGLVAVLIVILALWRKLRVEERGMRKLFGDAYRNYESRVSALVPFVL